MTSEDAPKPGKTRKVVLIVLGIVGGVVLVSAGVIVVYLAAMAVLDPKKNVSESWSTVYTVGDYKTDNRDSFEAYLAATTFLDEISASRLEEAYQRFAQQAPKATFESFRAQIDKLPALKDRGNFKLEGGAVGQTAAFKGRVDDPNGMIITISLELVKEDGAWKIARCVFGL